MISPTVPPGLPSSPTSQVIITNQPRYQHLVKVHTQGKEGEFLSSLKSLVPFKKGQTICKIENYYTGQEKRWSSVQYSETEHLELNSELIYMNHSCNPSIAIDLAKMEIVALRDIQVDDDLTFFYPSTEWEMAQPFQCWCGSEKCCGWIRGAKYLNREQMGDYFLNPHILRMLNTQ